MKNSNSVKKTAKKNVIENTPELTINAENAAELTLNIVESAANRTYSLIQQHLLENKATALFNKTKKTQNKNAVLCLAAMSDDTELLDYLIEHHSDKLKKSKEGRGLLSYVAEHARTSTVKHLIEKHHLDPATEKNNQGSTLLHFAAVGGKNETIELLTEKYQFNIAEANNEGNLATHFAACGGQNETIKLLVKQGLNLASLNNKGCTAFHYAAVFGKNETMALLVKHGADPHAEDSNGQSALHLAAMEGRNETIECLIKEYQLNPAKSNGTGHTALDFAAGCGKNETIDLLVKHGLDPNKKSAAGINLLLHFASQNGHMKTIQHLVEKYKFNPAEKTNAGQSILDIVLERGFKNLAYPLLSQFPALRSDGVGKKLWQSYQMRAELPHTLAQFAYNLEKTNKGDFLRFPVEVMQTIADLTDAGNNQSLTEEQRNKLPEPDNKVLGEEYKYYCQHYANKK